MSLRTTRSSSDRSIELEVLKRRLFGDRPVSQIGPERQSFRAAVREIWSYRDLLVLLTRRDISVRYKQSAVGIGWAIIQPLLMMTIFTVVFGRFARLPSEGYPYSIFVLSALLPWMLFARALSDASGSLTQSANLVTKVYFPRVIIPISKSLAGIADFAVAAVMLLVLLIYFGIKPSAGLLLLPIFTMLAISTALGVGLWLASLNVRYRDVGIVVPFIGQLWMYVSPVAYSVEIVPDHLRFFYSLNPMVAIVEGFRWALLGKAPPDPASFAVSIATTALLVMTGWMMFNRSERSFADLI